MRSKNKVRYFIISFLILKVLAGDIFLSERIESHTTALREYVKQLTDDERKTRYIVYKDINEIKSDYTGYRVYTFTTTLFIVFCLLVCERRQEEKDNAKRC